MWSLTPESYYNFIKISICIVVLFLVDNEQKVLLLIMIMSELSVFRSNAVILFILDVYSVYFEILYYFLYCIYNFFHFHEY